MNFEQLRQLDAVARLGTISAAATRLRISQPALSRSLARLESELGAQLLDRRGKSVAMSAAGEAALEYARAILHEERLMRMAVDEAVHRASTLVVGTVAPAPLWRLTALIVERFPDRLLSSRTMAQQDVEREVMDHEIDLGISFKPLTYPAVRCCHLMDERLSVSLPCGHPLAERAKLTFADLQNETFLLYNNIGFWRDLTDEHLPHATFIVQEDYAVFQQLAHTSPALTFITDAAYLAADMPNRVTVPLDEPDACAHFYLLASASGSRQAAEIFDWVQAQTRQ